MVYLSLIRRITIAFALSICGVTVGADTDPEKLRQEIISTWIVAVDGEARTRTLNVKGAELKEAGVWGLDATYGWSDKRQKEVKADLVTKADRFMVQLTTQADSVIVAEGPDLKKLVGTFTTRTGTVKAVTLERLSSDELTKRVAANKPQIVTPGLGSVLNHAHSDMPYAIEVE